MMKFVPESEIDFDTATIVTETEIRLVIPYLGGFAKAFRKEPGFSEGGDAETNAKAFENVAKLLSQLANLGGAA